MCIREQVTQTIINMIEEGVGKWEQPWRKLGARGMPSNYATGHRYSGVNVLLLWIAAQERGYSLNQWMTFNQANELGAKVRKGAKGVMCIFYKLVERSEPHDGGETEGDGRSIPLLKPFWLFNVADIEGLQQEAAPSDARVNYIDEGELVLQASGATLQHGGDVACYVPSMDLIRLPAAEQFKSAEDYYATAMHELIHWTGGESRLNRAFGKRFGDDAYAFEELVAELGAAFLLSDLGMAEYSLPGHASYLAHWLKVLRSDKNAIFTAAKHATAAYQLLMERAGRDQSSDQ